MAYSKQTWTNDESAVLDTRMNHIEQGIYDNSLATDKINPSGTATTTAEIEEGQISDVIGFKSLKLKGQTSQETTQGNNLLNIYTRHPAGYTETVSGVTFTYNNDGSINANGTATADINYFIASKGQLGDDIFNGTNYLSGCTGGSLTTFYLQFWADTIGTYPQATTEVATSKTAGVNWNITIGIKNRVAINKTFYPMMSATSGKTFEKYSGGKASPNPDFPQEVNNVSGDNVVRISNKNLYDKDDSNLIMNNVYINATGFVLTSSNNMKTICMPCRANTTYTVSKTLSSRFIIGTASSNTIGTSMTAGRTNPSGTQVSVTSGANDKYLFVFYYHGSADTKTEQEIRNSIQVEIGSSATSYIAHQGNNFDIDLPVENLLDITTADRSNQGVNLYNNHNGTVTLNGKATATSGGLSLLSSNTSLPVSTFNGTVTFSVKEPLPTGVELAFAYGDSTGTWISNIARLVGSTKSVTATINPPSNAVYFRVNFSVASGTELKNLLVCPQIEKENKANAFTPYGTNPIELCKIGTYQDYIYKKDGKWFKHKEFEKLKLSDYNWTLANNTSISNINTNRWFVAYSCSRITNNNMQVTMSNILPKGSANITYGQDVLSIGQSTSQLIIRMPVEYTTASDVKTALAELNAVGYALLGTPIEEEITYAPLLRQLDELYNSGLYDVTNISQDNSSEAFILDLEACKNNINGIVEYIRR